MTQEVIIKEYAGTNGEGESLYLEGYAIKVRIETGHFRAFDNHGKEFTARGKVFFGKGVFIPIGSKVEFEGNEYTLAGLTKIFGFGEHHAEGILN